ncbi:Receptor protein-tyrosine kinase [Paragonimus heterotremus]|uniref:receptor protein-tyrosine kinase n=1 Tax=Paragonimus heterotremus TaxID=100268 RepID=A0A8J4TMJ6_9TREM|nr:Receptor protein-tyrosine kinase [Paragonimus heterotremus]
MNTVSFYLVVLIVFNLTEYGLSEHDKFKACRVYLKDCGKTFLSGFPLKYFQQHYGKCKFILGNLVLCDLKRLDNGSDPDLSFLEDIVEVSGYVYLSRNEVRTIPLKSLKVIRGVPSYRFDDVEGALVVTRNGRNSTYGLETIDLRSLVAIQNHNVVVKDNPLLCNFAATIHWTELFLNPAQQKYIPIRTNLSISQEGCNISQTYQSCDGQCPMFDGQSYCWGPGSELCQKMLKCRNNPQKYCVDGPASDQYCDEECLGGCENSPGNCRACKNAENAGKCVNQCPPEFIVNPVDSRTIRNKDFRYNFHDICVQQCPAPFLKSKTYCVIECDYTRETPVNDTCQACPPEGCPEHCTQESIFGRKGFAILDSPALRKFESCVHFTGMIYVSEESFRGSRNVTDPVRDLSLLWNLRKLRAIVGSIYMDLRGAPPELTNLTFFENLQSLVLESRGASSGTVLQILNGKNVEMLGFRMLTHIDGPIFLENMTKLCYLDALKKMTLYRDRNVSTSEQCARRNAFCHSECLPQLGCWGPGANMCLHCCNLQAGTHCVSECTDQPGFYELPDESGVKPRALLQGIGDLGQPFCRTLPINGSQQDQLSDAMIRVSKLPAKQCGHCHDECAETCYGPGAHECKGKCKHFQHGDRCVMDCPIDTYVDSETNRCLPCNSSCIPLKIRRCSGPGDYFGLGGCTACWTVIHDLSTNQFHCITNDCPFKHYTESHKTLEFVRKQNILITADSHTAASVQSEGGGMIRVCKPCHPFCSVCTANGTHESICHSCLHWWFRSECVESCPPTETYTVTSEDAEPVNRTNIPSNVTEPDQAKRLPDDMQPTINTLSQTDQIRSRTKNKWYLASRDPSQRRCLLCHTECVQGCSGPGPDSCVKCRNYKIMINIEENKFICNSSCPDNQPRVFHGMCTTEAQYAELSGRSARDFRDRILIGISAAIIIVIVLVTIIMALCLKRKAETEKIREKLFSAYTNLLEPDKESVMKNQSGIREPNMGRLEMISTSDLDVDYKATPLGTGAFGVVYRGVWRPSKAALLKHGCYGAHHFDVAVKVIQNDYPITPSVLNAETPTVNDTPKDPEEEARRAIARTNMEELLQEAKVMASVEHKHCLPLIGVCLTRERHCLVSMFLELGSLDRYVKEYRDELNSLTLLSWAEQIADGMSYLELRGIIHRDLAARNVLVQRRDLVQITDFGLAKMLERPDEHSVVVRAGRVPIRWLAIETLQDSIYSHKTDVWTYGVTLWEIFTYGRRPYEDVETKDIKDHVMKGGRLTQPEICTLDVYMVMVKCWMEDYESRPTFAELKRTFANFCKTPGRYLYIQGDEYAIHYHTSNYLGSTNQSSENHELHPLLSGRGAPDGSASPNANGSLFHGQRGGDLGANTIGYRNRHPCSFPTSSDLDYNQQSLNSDARHESLDVGPEPHESHSLLPVRAVGHSIWPSRNRPSAAHGGHPTLPLIDTSSDSGHSRPTAVGASSNKAPIAAREDSWLSEVPGSPPWRTARSPGVTAPLPNATMPSDTSGRLPNSTEVRQPPSSRAEPTRKPGQFSDVSDYQLPPPRSPPSAGLDGYLEPKSGLLPPAPRQVATTPIAVRPILEDYLLPKSRQPPMNHLNSKDFGISNMEYFLQPYMTTDTLSTGSATTEKKDQTNRTVN